MLTLQRITTEYRESEDRVRLSAEVAASTGDTTLVLWLSQRLLLRLLPPVFNWLEQLPSVATAGQPTGMARHTLADARTAELMQGFAQQSARHGIPVQTPVLPAAGSDEQLVTAVDLKAADASLTLVFKSAAGEVAALGLAPQQLRQWLAILHTLWRQAEWPMAIWPHWMQEDGPVATQPKALH